MPSLGREVLELEWRIPESDSGGKSMMVLRSTAVRGPQADTRSAQDAL